MINMLLVIPDTLSSMFEALMMHSLAVLGVYVVACFFLTIIGLGPLVGTMNRGLMRVVGMLVGALVAGVASLLVVLLGRGVPAMMAMTTLWPRRLRLKNPTTTPIVRTIKINPANMPDLHRLAHGNHTTPAGVLKGVHKVTVGQSGSAKNQTDINYEIQHQLELSPEHLVIVDPKGPAPLTQIAKAYAKPGDRLFVYSFHQRDPTSSAIRLYADGDRLSDTAYMMCDEPGAQDLHWTSKAAELIEAVAKALTELQRGPVPAPEGGDDNITVSLLEVRDVIADRKKLEKLIKISPLVSNVSDQEKEWGYIRSTAQRRLKALSSPTVRRVFAAAEDTEQPDFSRRDGRDIVVIRPDPKSAKRLTRYIHAVLDVVYRSAADGGDAGGPGTKVIIDEAASYMRLDHLDEYLDIGRESQVQVTYVLQSLKQLTAKLSVQQGEHIISSTEIKVVGATSDTDTAAFLSRLSGRDRVEYRGPRQDDELLAGWRESERATLMDTEVLKQVEAHWIVQHGPNMQKVQVADKHYHYLQAAEAQDLQICGAVTGKFTPPRIGDGGSLWESEDIEDDEPDGFDGGADDEDGDFFDR